ncbi:MAG: DUF1501 domain-containing protein [Tepidisphaeraceae bacterium]
MTHTRRIFLQRGLALVSAGVTVPSFIDNTVLAIDDPYDVKRTQRASGHDSPILVVVQLSGGNDGLSTVIPYADDAYQRARPGLAKKANDTLKLTDYLGLNANLTGIKGLYDDGMASVLQGVGYPNPNRSHFRSMDIWQTGIPEKEMVTSGWIGRYFDNTCSGEDPHEGLAFGDTAPLAMKGEKTSPLSFDKAGNYRYKGKDSSRYAELNHADVPEPATKPSVSRNAPPKIITPDNQLDFLTRTAMDAQVSSDKILDIVGRNSSTQTYPGGNFGEGLKTVAAMIKGNLPTKVYYVSLGGFDTHAGQAGRHDNLMKQFDQGVAAFWKDIKEQKNEQRVMMMCFSEFGRRVQQNASGGTDHGAAAPMFLFGPAIAKRAGIVGKHPSLTDLDGGDLKYGIDFRNVYASILQNWMKTPSKPVLGRQFEPLPIFKA